MAQSVPLNRDDQQGIARDPLLDEAEHAFDISEDLKASWEPAAFLMSNEVHVAAGGGILKRLFGTDP
ncbi:hypothetical protein DEM27_22385 [Metarhizobium album]|uniref:Uncharacterized protein n=1 Tax=Metarhizobium album TaxID=2182425 RepID=A0A2U2DLC9_9HYPH|nr:hypothetical protein [Rhizobium album]PWE54061.1 hypothetical protein DEM27_22385 [Rhizobium album]